MTNEEKQQDQSEPTKIAKTQKKQKKRQKENMKKTSFEQINNMESPNNWKNSFPYKIKHSEMKAKKAKNMEKSEKKWKTDCKETCEENKMLNLKIGKIRFSNPKIWQEIRV